MTSLYALVVTSLHAGKLFMIFCSLKIFFKINVFKTSYQNTIRVSNILDPDQAQHNVGPNLGPNCLRRLTADDTSRYRVEYKWR